MSIARGHSSRNNASEMMVRLPSLLAVRKGAMGVR
jgi:hypothetical protein